MRIEISAMFCWAINVWLSVVSSISLWLILRHHPRFVLIINNKLVPASPSKTFYWLILHTVQSKLSSSYDTCTALHTDTEQSKECSNDVLESRSLLGIGDTASFSGTDVITVISTVELSALQILSPSSLCAISNIWYISVLEAWKPYDGGRNRNHQLPFHIRL